MFKEIPSYSADELNTFLCRLMAIGAVKVDTKQGFRFKHHEKHPEAPLSPSYVNLRVPENKGVLAHVDVETVARFMHGYLRANQIGFHGICPVPRAGDPFAKELQAIFYEEDGLSVSIITLGKEEGPEGRRVGKVLKTQGLPRGCKILVVDDLITRSVSKVETIEQLRSAGFVVEDCIVFLDRQQGGPRELQEKHGVKLHSIVQFKSMFDLYFERGLITEEEYGEVMSYQMAEQRQAQAA